MFARNLTSLVLLTASAALSLLVGFVLFDGGQAVGLIKGFGYWVMLGTFIALLYTLGGRLRDGSPYLRQRARGLAGPATFVFVASLVLLAIQPTGYKITMDEPVLAATALRMHEYREVMTTVRAHDLQGVFTQLDGYVDKRPYFYPFLVSLLHDLTGFRSGNPFLLNALLTPILLGLVFLWGGWLWPRYGGYFAVLLFATVPLVAMNANGGGFDLLNLVMILATAWAAKSWLEKPEARRLDILVLLAVLLAQTRYESVLYILPVGVAVLLGWRKAGQLVITPILILTPLLLIPFPLQQAIVQQYAGLQELKEGVESRFSFGYVADNLGHAANYFFNWSDDQQPNSLLLSVLFVMALSWAGTVGLKRWREADVPPAPRTAALLFGAVMVFNFFLLMAYYWGQADDIIATRIILPFILLQVLLAGYVLGTFARPRLTGTVAVTASLVYCLGVTLPLCSRSDFLRWIPGHHECLWVQEQATFFKGQKVLIVSNKHLAAIGEKVPAIPEFMANKHKARLQLHLDLGSFEGIYFAHEMVPDLEVPDELKAGTPIYSDFVLETVKEELIGDRRVMRLSRLKAVKFDEGEARMIDTTGFSGLSEGPERLGFYAETLP